MQNNMKTNVLKNEFNFEKLNNAIIEHCEMYYNYDESTMKNHVHELTQNIIKLLCEKIQNIYGVCDFEINFIINDMCINECYLFIVETKITNNVANFSHYNIFDFDDVIEMYDIELSNDLIANYYMQKFQ